MPVDGCGRVPWRFATAALALAAAAVAEPALAQAPPRAETLAACDACHGPAGSSQVPETPSIAGQPRLFIENQLVLIREGLREVPTMAGIIKGMSDEEIGAVARHYATQRAVPLPSTVRRDQRLRGAEISRRALCGTCHLADYSGQNQVPRLAGQNEAYLRLSLKQFRDHPGPGRDTIMAATLLGMSDADLADLAHYFATPRP
jgi:cytochrome c553